MIFQIAAGLVGAVLCAAIGYFVLEKAFRIPYGRYDPVDSVSCVDT